MEGGQVTCGKHLPEAHPAQDRQGGGGDCRSPRWSARPETGLFGQEYQAFRSLSDQLARLREVTRGIETD